MSRLSLYHAVLRKCFKDFCHLIAKMDTKALHYPNLKGEVRSYRNCQKQQIVGNFFHVYCSDLQAQTVSDVRTACCDGVTRAES